MSLRTIFLDELVTLAKKGDAGLAAKMREVMVDRHPATLDPDEHDPVGTVALAWTEVARRGRPAFEASAEKLLASIEEARLQADHTACDWPFAHAVIRLLSMLPHEIVEPTTKGRCVRRLSGLVADRQEFLELVAGSYPEPDVLWKDAFRLYLNWHTLEPGWLDTLWKTALRDGSWPLEQGAFPFLEDAARRFPSFISMDRLVCFWRAAVERGATIQDLRRWFYVIGTSLEDSPEGKERLGSLFENFGGHLQDHRFDAPHSAWEGFIECVAAMFRNAEKHRAIIAYKAACRIPESVRTRQHSIPAEFKASPDTVQRELVSFLTITPNPGY